MADITRGKELVRRIFTEGMAEGRTDVVDECLAPDAVDDRHGDFRAHLKEVVRGFHTAFPDLAPEVTHMVGEGDTIAVRVVLRGRHEGPLQMPGMPFPLPPTGRRLAIEQYHVITVDDEGRGRRHWAAVGEEEMKRQLGVTQPSAV